MALAVNGYATCTTAAATAAKTATISSFTLTAGSIIVIKFANGNTAGNPTLNISSKGARPLYSGNSAMGALPANYKALLQYDGTYYNLLNAPFSASGIMVSGLLKGDGAGNISAAVADTDYTTPAGLASGLAAKTTALLKMTGYSMPGSASSVTAADTVNTAIGKLEKGLQNAGNGGTASGFDWQNVKTFGAKGDGKTDDTAAIQSAINAGSVVYFPQGTYVVNELFIENKSNVVLWGYTATLLKKAGSANFSTALNITNSSNIKVLGLTFDGNKGNVAGNGSTTGCPSIKGQTLNNFLFKDLTVKNSGYGSTVYADCHYGYIQDCVFDDLDVGILGMAQSNSYLNIDNCLFSNGTSEGVSLGIYTSDVTPAIFKTIGYHDHIKITNNRFINKNGGCIQLRNATNVLIANNYFERTDTKKETSGIAIDPDAVTGLNIMPDNIVITSNVFRGVLYSGVLATAGTNLVVKDNYFDSVKSLNINVKCACIIKNNIFANLQSTTQTVIWAQTNNVKIIDNYFKADSVSLSSIIGISNATGGTEIIDNVLSKSSANTSTPIGYENSSPSAATVSGNIGF